MDYSPDTTGLPVIWFHPGQKLKQNSVCIGFVLNPGVSCVKDLRAFCQSAVLVVSTHDRHDFFGPLLRVLGAWSARDVPNTDGKHYMRLFPPLPLKDLQVNLLFATETKFEHEVEIMVGAVCAAEDGMA